ncbi:MAG: S8 family serine peptidase [Candidatus Zipacnadales bacterium]
MPNASHPRWTVLFALIPAGLLFAPPARSQPLPLVDVSPWPDKLAQRLPYRPNQITVQFEGPISRERAFGVVKTLGSQVIYSARYVPGLHVVTLPRGKTLAQALEAYTQHPDVRFAEPNYVDYPADSLAFVPNDPLYEKQWHLQLIGCPTAWDITQGSPAVVVAIVDSGIAFKSVSGHPRAPDLAGVQFTKPYDAVDGDNLPVDDVNHGTHVCGTVAQATNNGIGVAGIAPLCKIMPVRALGPGGGDHAQMADAFHWAADNGAHIINYSAGGLSSQVKEEAIKYASNKGLLIIAAMGNEGQYNSSSAYPARYPEVVGVGACKLNKTHADYSNYGDGVEITGPGGELSEDLDSNGSPDGVLQNTFASGMPSGGFKYYYMAGTSMAAPHVTGTAALIYSKLLADGVSPTREQVRNILRQSAEDLGPSGFDETFGYGLVRADQALKRIGSVPPTLDWLGTVGYETDGVKPNKGPVGTTFRFRVKYTDEEGDAPQTAELQIDRCLYTGTWERYRNETLTARSGTIKTGQEYFAALQLPNDVYRYRFLMKDKDGVATGRPARWKNGPFLLAPPFLCWLGEGKYKSDGVHPDGSDAPGRRFTFCVRYRDSFGNAPQRRDLVLWRNGSFFGRYRLNPQADGDLRLGKVFAFTVKLEQAGTYQYRFDFADVHGTASGAPRRWKSLEIKESAASATAQITALTALQNLRGGQIVFALSADATVSVQLLNIAGRPVRTLLHQRHLAAGTHTVLWDGRTDTGTLVPAGTYLVHLSAASDSGGWVDGMTALTVRR